jgi:hypothetical protein
VQQPRRTTRSDASARRLLCHASAQIDGSGARTSRQSRTLCLPRGRAGKNAFGSRRRRSMTARRSIHSRNSQPGATSRRVRRSS